MIFPLNHENAASCHGRNETWDTHGNAFPHLKNDLLPPMDRCASVLLDDLEARELLESTNQR